MSCRAFMFPGTDFLVVGLDFFPFCRKPIDANDYHFFSKKFGQMRR